LIPRIPSRDARDTRARRTTSSEPRTRKVEAVPQEAIDRLLQAWRGEVEAGAVYELMSLNTKTSDGAPDKAVLCLVSLTSRATAAT
jgi:hypothetical protein